MVLDESEKALFFVAFLQVLDVNVIIADWSKGSNGAYAEAVKNCPETAASLGDFLDWLNHLGVPFRNMHLIGHSLGGQLAALACRACTRGSVGYLTSMYLKKSICNIGPC